MANLTSKEWRDLIFEGKNKEFGAYDLRKKSEKRHTLAVIYTLVALAILVLAIFGYSKYRDAKLEEEREAALKLAAIQAEQVEQIEEEEEAPEEEEQRYEEEQPEVIEVPEEVQATIQQTAIAIVDEVKNEVRDIQEQIEDNTTRGVVNQEGGDDVDHLKTVKEQVVVVEEPKPVEKPQPEKIFEAVEQPAEFPGGQAALMKWLSNNIRYPDSAQQNGVQGRVIVKFVVEKDGSISNAQVVKGVDRDLDQEALRVVKKMPKWQPGKNNGQAVRAYFTLPVQFKLAN